MVTLRRFQQFIAVAEELSFSKAAERLHMAQPPLTNAILKLEDEVGAALFRRLGRQIELTFAGEMFLAEAQLVVNQVDRAVAVARAAGSGIIGTLRVGYTASTSYEFMPALLKAFRRDHPQVQVDLYEYATWDQLEGLRAKRLDVGLLRPPRSWPAGIVHETLARERLLALVPRDHPLASRRTLRLADLAGEPLVLFQPSLANRHYGQLMDACTDAGFAPVVEQETAGMLAMVSFVASGVGIGFGPRALQAIHQPGVVYIELDDDSDKLYFDLVLAWDETRDLPALANFIAVAQRVARDVD